MAETQARSNAQRLADVEEAVSALREQLAVMDERLQAGAYFEYMLREQKARDPKALAETAKATLKRARDRFAGKYRWKVKTTDGEGNETKLPSYFECDTKDENMARHVYSERTGADGHDRKQHHFELVEKEEVAVA